MGLLTNPTSEEKIPKLFIAYHKQLCLFSYLIGLTWFLLLAHKPLGLGMYFSENALLPGLVRNEFDGQYDAKNYYETLKIEADNYFSDVPVPWLLASFKQIGLEAYTQDFTLHKPLSKSNFTGVNVYAILRAPRSTSTEALLLSTPYRSESSVFPNTLPSIAIMLSLAKYFRKHTYWAKDIIFLITEHEQLGMQAWLEAYHHTSISNGVLESNDLLGRSGSLQAAINLEIPSNKINIIDIKIEGLNGQLPNLDLFHLVMHLCKREGFRITFKGREDYAKKNEYQTWRHSFKTMLAMMRSQATGVPSGNHGLLHRFHIEALTIEGKYAAKYKANGFFEIGMVIEGIFRSLNNLLERFHQSYFFYLLPSTTRFVSIGLYMPPFSLLALGLLIKALTLRFETSILAEKQTIKIEKGDEGKGDAQREMELHSKVDYSFTLTLPILILTHTLGFLIYLSPEYFYMIGKYFGIKMEISLFIGLASSFLAMLVLPSFITMKDSSGTIRSWSVLKCVSLLELAALLFAVAFVNFSLACIVTLMYVPICIEISPSAQRFLRWIKGLPVLLVSPLALVFLFVTYDTFAIYPEASLLEILRRSYVATRNALIYCVMDDYVYGNWMFKLCSTTLLPIWLQFWIITQLKTV